MEATHEPINLDHYVFKYIAESLEGASPEAIVAFYVDKFVFKNGDYFKGLMGKYHLPNDFLRLHKKITELAKEATHDNTTTSD